MPVTKLADTATRKTGTVFQDTSHSLISNSTGGVQTAPCRAAAVLHGKRRVHILDSTPRRQSISPHTRVHSKVRTMN